MQLKLYLHYINCTYKPVYLRANESLACVPGFQVIMLAAGSPRREPLLLLALLALLASPVVPSSPPDPEQAARLENSLLSMLSLSKRPRPERSKTAIPAALLELYRRQAGLDVDTTSLHTPGRHTRGANTVRTFTHKGELTFLRWRTDQRIFR